MEAPALADRLGALGLPGVGFRPAWFRPAFGKHAGAVCQGIELHVRDRLALQPVSTGLAILKGVRDLTPERFGWRQEAYEFVSDIPALDLLTGSAGARETIDGQRPLEPLLSRWEAEAAEFSERLDGVLLYR